MSKSLWQRLKTWYHLAKTKRSKERGENVAGAIGENLLRSYFQNDLSHKEAHIFLNKRVPSGQAGKRKEIDVLVITRKQIHVIEVKNWSGKICSKGEKWLQIRRNGTEVEHPNLTEYNDEKAKVLRKFFIKKGIEIPEEYFSQKVIFVNKNLEIEKKIADNPNIIDLKKIKSYVKAQKQVSFSEKVMCSIVEFCVGAEKAANLVDTLFQSLTNEKFTRLLTCVKNMATWDRVVLHGTKKINGDLLKIQTQNQKIRREDLSDVDQIDLTWTRNKWWGSHQNIFVFRARNARNSK